MTTLDPRRLRTPAVATLAALGSIVLCGWLTIAYPAFGAPQPFYGFMYIPPQAFLVALLAPTTCFLAFTTGIRGLRQSQRARQPVWAGTFTVLVLLLLLGPAYLICSFGVGWEVPHPPAIPTPEDLGWQADAWWWLTGGSIAVVLLTALCGLVYGRQALVLPEQPSGQP